MKTKEERKERRRQAVAKLRELFPLGRDIPTRPQLENIQAALVLSSAIGSWALSRFDPSMLPAIEEAWQALKEELADTPDDLAGLAAREQ